MRKCVNGDAFLLTGVCSEEFTPSSGIFLTSAGCMLHCMNEVQGSFPPTGALVRDSISC